MNQILDNPVPLLNGLPEGTLALALLLLVSLLLIFAGKRVVKVLAFLAVGIIGAAVGGTLGVVYFGEVGGLLGLVLGFVLGGLAGVLLISLGIGLVTGYAAYLLALDFVASPIALIIGVVFFVIGLALSGKILSILTAVGGGILFYDVLRQFGLGLDISAVVAIVAAIAGIWVQTSSGRRASKTTVGPTGGPAQMMVLYEPTK